MIDCKGLTGKKKIEYIWEYYKIHIIVGVIALILVGSFIHSKITEIHYVFNLTVIGSSVKPDKTAEFENKLTSVVLKNPGKNQSAEFDNIPIQNIIGSSDGNAYQYMQKIMAEASANVLDAVILSRADYDNFVKNGLFLNLEKTSLDLNKYKDISIPGETKEGEKGTFAISIENSKILKDYGMDTSDKVICIVGSSKQKDKAVSAFKWILGS